MKGLKYYCNDLEYYCKDLELLQGFKRVYVSNKAYYFVTVLSPFIYWII